MQDRELEPAGGCCGSGSGSQAHAASSQLGGRWTLGLVRLDNDVARGNASFTDDVRRSGLLRLLRMRLTRSAAMSLNAGRDGPSNWSATPQSRLPGRVPEPVSRVMPRSTW